MCTLTILPRAETDSEFTDTPWRLRVACNRDESVLRAPALPPVLTEFGGRAGTMPVDPSSRGTWIGVNDASLVFSLLNANPPQGSPRGPGPVSRGTIIPRMLACATLDEALESAMALDAAQFAPFCLVMIDPREVIELAIVDGRVRPVERTPLDGPRMFTSSGLGDSVVGPPRRQLFFETFADAAPESWAARQNAYHAHHWPDQPQVSVCMNRPDAKTLSFTVVELTTSRASLTYWPTPPDCLDGAQRVEFSLATR